MFRVPRTAIALLAASLCVASVQVRADQRVTVLAKQIEGPLLNDFELPGDADLYFRLGVFDSADPALLAAYGAGGVDDGLAATLDGQTGDFFAADPKANHPFGAVWDFFDLQISKVTPTGPVFIYFGLLDRDAPGVDDQIGNHWLATAAGQVLVKEANNNTSPYQATSAGGQPIAEAGLVNNFRLWLDVIVEPIHADFNEDGDVDGADFLTWQRGVGAATAAPFSQGDANRDRAVDGADLAVWRSQFGTPTLALAVPEPASMALMALTPPLVLAVRAARRTRLSCWRRCPGCRR